MRRGNQIKQKRIKIQQIAHRLGRKAVALALAVALYAVPLAAQEVNGTYRDIEATLGSIPTFFKLFPEEGIGGAWAEFKSVQLNPKTALSGKEKELIGLAVAVAAITMHWSTVLNGMRADLAGFQREIDAVLRLAAERAKTTLANP